MCLFYIDMTVIQRLLYNCVVLFFVLLLVLVTRFTKAIFHLLFSRSNVGFVFILHSIVHSTTKNIFFVLWNALFFRFSLWLYRNCYQLMPLTRLDCCYSSIQWDSDYTKWISDVVEVCIRYSSLYRSALAVLFSFFFALLYELPLYSSMFRITAQTPKIKLFFFEHLILLRLAELWLFWVFIRVCTKYFHVSTDSIFMCIFRLHSATSCVRTRCPVSDAVFLFIYQMSAVYLSFYWFVSFKATT